MERNEAIDRVRQLYTDANDENKAALEALIPELADSEDERIRKEIRTLYNEIDSCIDELLKARTDKDTEAEGKALFKMEGLMVATLQDLSCIEDYLEKQKEQEPAECVPDSVKFDVGFKTGREIGFREGAESVKPAEWSEEDERNYEYLHQAICNYINNRHIEYKEWEKASKILIPFWERLKSRRPQPHKDIKFEPKEGDIVVNKDGVIAIFESWGHHPDGGSFNDYSYFFAKCTLDDNCYNEIDCHPDSFGLRYATLEEIRKLVPYLLASSQPQWKPSEEQMKALCSKLPIVKGDGDKIQDILETLYDDLKKL